MPATPPLTDNAALNAILTQAELIAGAMGRTYVDVIGSNSLSVNSDGVIVAANEYVVKRVVTNLGNNACEVYEAGSLVAVLSKYQTWESPLTGSGEIRLQCSVEGEESTVAVASYVEEATTIEITQL